MKALIAFAKEAGIGLATMVAAGALGAVMRALEDKSFADFPVGGLALAALVGGFSLGIAMTVARYWR
jgi:hypothetical protein